MRENTMMVLLFLVWNILALISPAKATIRREDGPEISRYKEYQRNIQFPHLMLQNQENEREEMNHESRTRTKLALPLQRKRSPTTANDLLKMFKGRKKCWFFVNNNKQCFDGNIRSVTAPKKKNKFWMTGKKKSIDQWKKMKNNFWIPGKRKTSIEHWREENKPALKLIWNMAQILRELKSENDQRKGFWRTGRKDSPLE